MEKLRSTFLVCIIFLLGNVGLAFAQPRIIRGTVTDEKGATMPGVSVMIKGTSTGTQTGVDGKFSLGVSAEKAVLQFSFVGFESQELPVNATTIDVVMKEKGSVLSEVVVMAFATQKKVNVTGAVSTVSGKDLVATPVANITNALIGSTPGIGGLQTSGEPGRNTADIFIRGKATYGNTTPLVVIDGVEQAAERAFDELNAIDANEVAGMFAHGAVFIDLAPLKDPQEMLAAHVTATPEPTIEPTRASDS